MPKYIQIVAPISKGLISPGSITNTEISATAAIALTKLASNPVPQLQRASGTVAVGATETDIVTVTPTRTPCQIRVLLQDASSQAYAPTYKVTDQANNVLTTGSCHLIAWDGTAYLYASSLSLANLTITGPTAYYCTVSFIGTPGASVTTVKVRGVRAAGAVAGNISAELEVVS